jgi:uncharacterized membrane protein
MAGLFSSSGFFLFGFNSKDRAKLTSDIKEQGGNVFFSVSKAVRPSAIITINTANIWVLSIFGCNSQFMPPKSLWFAHSTPAEVTNAVFLNSFLFAIFAFNDAFFSLKVLKQC